MWEQFIVDELRREGKKLRRELSIFWSIAAIMLILGLLGVTQLPIVFVMGLYSSTNTTYCVLVCRKKKKEEVVYQPRR